MSVVRVLLLKLDPAKQIPAWLKLAVQTLPTFGLVSSYLKTDKNACLARLSKKELGYCLNEAYCGAWHEASAPQRIVVTIMAYPRSHWLVRQDSVSQVSGSRNLTKMKILVLQARDEEGTKSP